MGMESIEKFKPYYFSAKLIFGQEKSIEVLSLNVNV